MSADTVLDEATMDVILSAGYSRIPIYEPGNESNFVGMLLVKILITYDPEDCKKVREFALATLPETRPETSCLDIVNFFQEGKSHMVLVSEDPGENFGAIGVVTLEDVIEELIGEYVTYPSRLTQKLIEIGKLLTNPMSTLMFTRLLDVSIQHQRHAFLKVMLLTQHRQCLT
jgi:CBS domain containing-hemolysin-like protein